MKAQVYKLLLAGCLLMLSVAGHAQNAKDSPDTSLAQIPEQCRCAYLLGMLTADASAEAVVRAVVATGLSLSDATLDAMECGGQGHPVAIAVAGVKLSSSLAQAQGVASAVLSAAGQDSELAAAVRESVRLFARDLPQPGVYVDEYTPTGGADVSPAN